MITQPHLSYLLELWAGLGPAARHFVLAGAQAMKFWLPGARVTRDFDFLLDVLALRGLDLRLAERLSGLGYEPAPEAQNFQFWKGIPGTKEVMRIEFMGPDSRTRRGDWRVDVQEGVHARACAGADVALAESDAHLISGHLPSGEPAGAQIRVIRPWALVMLKCLALEDRYRNVRGPQHADHDRNEARIHADDIVSIVASQASREVFCERFLGQLVASPALRERVLRAVRDFFADQMRPGLLLYEELLAMRSSPDDTERVQQALARAERFLAPLAAVCAQHLSAEPGERVRQ